MVPAIKNLRFSVLYYLCTLLLLDFQRIKLCMVNEGIINWSPIKSLTKGSSALKTFGGYSKKEENNVGCLLSLVKWLIGIQI